MAISDELQRIYASAPENKIFFDALVLSHPNWAEDYAIINHSAFDRVLNFEGQPLTFKASSFRLNLPKRDDQGLVELSLQFPNTGKVLIDPIEAAVGSGVAITATVTVYTEDSLDPAMTPIVLSLNQMTIDVNNVVAGATRIDLLNTAFPRKIARIDNYPGLYR